MLQLDKQTGTLLFSADCFLNAATQPQEIAILFPTSIIKINDTGPSWQRYTVRAVPVDNHFVWLSLYFEAAHLRHISFVMEKTILAEPGWENYTEEAERQKALQYQQWLHQQLGVASAWPWGKVWAGYDPRSGFSSVVISYTTP